MEEYTIIDVEQQVSHDTVIGKYAEHILDMHKKKYGDRAAQAVIERAVRIYAESQKQVENTSINNNILLVGKVQSGKTSNLEMLSAIAFDNGYNMLIIYGGYDNTLLEQTTGRFKKTFGIEDMGERGKPILLSTAMPNELAALNNDILEELIEEEKPIIITAMKRPNALDKVNTALKKLDASKIKAYIIDDEGDQASLNTSKDKSADSSATYAQICEMKRLLRNPLYFSVTATPHANIFLDDISELCPASAKLIEPGEGYCGGECYHMGDSDVIFPIDPDDTVAMDEGRMPDSLREALYHFILASVIIKYKGEEESTMIIHSYRNKDPHSLIYTMVNSFRDNLISQMSDEEGKKIALRRFSSMYDKYFSEEVKEKYPFESIEDDIPKVTKKVYVILKNSDGAATQGFEALKRHRIYVGGDLLQRGVTFENLLTTYYTRWAAQGNMDTNLQRARWFGYRRKYLDICKIFTTKEISEQYSALTDVELELWEQFHDVQEGNLRIDEMIISADSTKQRPTRGNVVNVKKLYFKKNWMKQRQGVFDFNQVSYNNAIVNQFLDTLEFSETSVGRADNETSALTAKTAPEQFAKLMDVMQGIFEHDPFDKVYLNKILSEESEINIIIMPDNDGKGRKRRFYSDNNVNNIHQGPDKTDVAARKYHGDAAVVVDKQQINIQIHKVRPYKDGEEVECCMQYMFAIFIPRAKKYYVRGDVE